MSITLGAVVLNCLLGLGLSHLTLISMFFSSPGSAAASTTIATLAFALLVLAASSTTVATSGGVLVSPRRIVIVVVLLILDDCESLFVCVMLSEVEVVGLVAAVATTAAASASASVAAILVLVISRAVTAFGLGLLLALCDGGRIISNWGISGGGGLPCSDWLGNCLSLLFDLGLFFGLLVLVWVGVNTLLCEKGLTLSSL